MNQLLYISFWVRKTRQNKQGLVPVVIRLTMNGKRLNIQPKINVKEENWDPVKQRVKSKDVDAKIINSSLDIIKQKIWTIYHNLLITNYLTLEEIVNQYENKPSAPKKGLVQLIQQHNEEFKKRLGIDRTQSTYEKYLFTLQKVQAFISFRYKKQEIPLSSVDKKWINDFYLFMRKEEENQHNTAAKYIKNLKHIMNFGVDLGWIQNNPTSSYICGFKETQQVILGPDELALIENRRFQMPRLELARKMFVLQCYTGLAYADMAKLEKKHLEQGPDGKLWLNLRRSKTDTAIRFPLLQTAVEIINELTEHVDKNDSRLLPQSYCNQKMNAYLKEIADLCGIEKRLTTHVGRRTMASTVLLGNGVPIETISKILGHLKISTTQVYAKVGDRLLSKEMKQLEKRISNK
jgi:site-specific recombinase XerD